MEKIQKRNSPSGKTPASRTRVEGSGSIPGVKSNIKVYIQWWSEEKVPLINKATFFWYLFFVFFPPLSPREPEMIWCESGSPGRAGCSGCGRICELAPRQVQQNTQTLIKLPVFTEREHACPCADTHTHTQRTHTRKNVAFSRLFRVGCWEYV